MYFFAWHCISECSRTEPGLPVHKSANESYDSRDYFNCPIKIIAMINRTMNHGYDSRDAFNSSIGIIAMINRTINHGYDSRDGFNKPVGIIMILEMMLIVLLES